MTVLITNKFYTKDGKTIELAISVEKNIDKAKYFSFILSVTGRNNLESIKSIKLFECGGHDYIDFIKEKNEYDIEDIKKIITNKKILSCL